MADFTALIVDVTTLAASCFLEVFLCNYVCGNVGCRFIKFVVTNAANALFGTYGALARMCVSIKLLLTNGTGFPVVILVI